MRLVLTETTRLLGSYNPISIYSFIIWTDFLTEAFSGLYPPVTGSRAICPVSPVGPPSHVFSDLSELW